jgi:hypothetical protein
VPPSSSVLVSQSVNQRWRERPRCPARPVTPGRRDGVVHAIVGRVACQRLLAHVVQDKRAARAARVRVEIRWNDPARKRNRNQFVRVAFVPEATSRLQIQTQASHHRADHVGAVLSLVKARATLCLLRLHFRKSRNSVCAIVAISFYPAALTQRTESVAQFLRVEDRRIDPPHAARDGLRARNDAAFEQQAGVRTQD